MNEGLTMAEKRLIDADKRIAEIKKQYCTDCNNYGGVRCRACWVDDAMGLIDESETVDAVEVVHGKWVFADDGYLRCSECTQKAPVVQPYDDEPTTTATNYCPNFGAIMDLED